MKYWQRRFLLLTVTTLALCGCTTASEVMADNGGGVDTKPDNNQAAATEDSSKAAWGVQHSNNNNNPKDMDKSETNVNQSATTPPPPPPPPSDKIPFVPPPKEGGNQQHKSDDKHSKTLNGGGSTSASSASFVSQSPPKSIPLLEQPHNPPEGFQITARVYTDPEDKKAHFDDSVTQVTLPYLDCGAVGSTTDPLLVKHAYFRHALGGPTRTPSVWRGSEYGPHPQLLIPLTTPLELTVNSGESRIFQAGDVILLEDVLTDGHNIKTPTEEQFEYLMLTLPQHYHHVGKDRVSLMGTTKTTRLNNPCPIDPHDPTSNNNNNHNSVFGVLPPSILRRKVAFGCVGGVLGAKLVEVLVKVAPLWLSVGFGGMGLIFSTIYGFVHGGEWCYDTVDLWLEKRRLERQAEDDDDPEEKADLTRMEFDPAATAEGIQEKMS